MMSEDTASNNKINLKKSIGILPACAIIVGNIIGSGIFITPSGVVKDSGSFGLALVVWFVSGLIPIIGGLCYTELGTMIHASGGDFAYINEAYGQFTAFLYSWMMIFLSIPCYNAVMSTAISQYIIELFFVGCVAPFYIIRLIAALILCFLGFINSLNVTFVSKLQTVVTITKVITFIIIITGGMWTFFRSSKSTTDMLDEWFTISGSFGFSRIALALYSCLFTYSGWNSLNFLTEELKNPNKNLPRAIIIAIPGVILIYLLTNVAFFVVLTPQEVIASETVALTFSTKVFSASLSWMIPIFIAFSAFGSLSGTILGCSRICYAAARDGMLPEMFSFINTRFFSPIISIILMTVLSMLMLLIEKLDILILYAAFAEFLFIGVSLSTVLYFRYTRPDAIRPIKIPIALPIIFLIICVFINALTLYQYPVETMIGLIFLAFGVPVYCVAILWKNKPKGFQRSLTQVNILLQKLFISVKED